MKFQDVHVVAHADAPPEVIFDLIADPATWPRWTGFATGALERPGTTTPFGVGAIRRMQRGRTTGREEVVAYERPRRFSYVLLSGLPVVDYRGDAELEADDGGTRITWHATFRPKLPLTGGISRRGIQKFIEEFVGDLASHVASQTVPSEHG